MRADMPSQLIFAIVTVNSTHSLILLMPACFGKGLVYSDRRRPNSIENEARVRLRF